MPGATNLYFDLEEQEAARLQAIAQGQLGFAFTDAVDRNAGYQRLAEDRNRIAAAAGPCKYCHNQTRFLPCAVCRTGGVPVPWPDQPGHRETIAVPTGERAGTYRHNGGAAIVDRPASLPDDADRRNEYPMAGGLLDYFPNALAEVARLSFMATQQHHANEDMHWDRSKSRDHRSKIMRHLIDTDTVDNKGLDHWAMVCWRALAGYQEYLEAKHGYPMSRASRA